MEANFVQAMYWSPQDTRDRFDLLDLYSAQDSFAWPRVDLARPLRLVDVRPFWIISFEFVKVCWFCFSTELGKLHWFLHLVLSYFYDPSLFIYRWSSNFVEKVV